jgi:hypothetical protein
MDNLSEALANLADAIYDAFSLVAQTITDIAETIEDFMDAYYASFDNPRRKRPPKCITMASQRFFKKQRVYKCRNNC